MGRVDQSAAKQQHRPAPPVDLSWSALQPRDWCDEFHDLAGALSSRPVRSCWPTIAEPLSPIVQLAQVVLASPAMKLPLGGEPVVRATG